MSTIKSKPMLFSGEMVRALLDGRKTQTRRIVKGEHLGCLNAGLGANNETCPYGAPGNLLWVRETWSDVNLQGVPGIAYRADNDVRDLMEVPSLLDQDGAFNYDDERVKPFSFAAWSEDLLSGVEGRWRPSIHMPRWASRLTLEIAGVRVERLQDISETDAIAEGIEPAGRLLPNHPNTYLTPDGNFARPTVAFQRLWQSINGPDSWGANPWVWVIEFTVHHCNVDALIKQREGQQQ